MILSYLNEKKKKRRRKIMDLLVFPCCSRYINNCLPLGWTGFKNGHCTGKLVVVLPSKKRFLGGLNPNLEKMGVIFCHHVNKKSVEFFFSSVLNKMNILDYSQFFQRSQFICLNIILMLSVLLFLIYWNKAHK